MVLPNGACDPPKGRSGLPTPAPTWVGLADVRLREGARLQGAILSGSPRRPPQPGPWPEAGGAVGAPGVRVGGEGGSVWGEESSGEGGCAGHSAEKELAVPSSYRRVGVQWYALRSVPFTAVESLSPSGRERDLGDHCP